MIKILFILVLYVQVMYADIGIVMSSLSTRDTISKHEVADIFLGRVTLHPASLKNIKLVLLPRESTAHIQFCTNFLNMDPLLYAITLKRLKSSNRNLIPARVNDELELLTFMQHHDSSIGYLDIYDHEWLLVGFEGTVTFIKVVN